MCGVPFGETAVCQAGTILIQPQSNVIVPPWLKPTTSSTPSSEISFASSTIASTWAPVRLAIATVSPMWSLWPWVSAITSAGSSSAVAAAFGLSVSQGSISTSAPPPERWNAACPSQRTSAAIRSPLSISSGRARSRPRRRSASRRASPRPAAAAPLCSDPRCRPCRPPRAPAAGGPRRTSSPLEGLVEDPLQRGRARLDDALRLLEPLRIGERLRRRHRPRRRSSYGGRRPLASHHTNASAMADRPSPRSATARAAAASCRPPTCARSWPRSRAPPTRACSWPPTPPTTPASCS